MLYRHVCVVRKMMFDLQNVFSKAVLESKAYSVAPLNKEVLKLDAMEAPEDFPEDLRMLWQKRLANQALNFYPPARFLPLEEKLREVFKVPDGCDVLCGNGSDELIQIILLALKKEGASVLAPAPTFVMYQMVSAFLGMRYVAVDLCADFSLHLSNMLAAIEKHQPSVVFLAQPNNPTGRCYSEKEVRLLIEATSGLFVLDEAYLPYSQETLAQRLLQDYKHVVILRTLSKIGFAGLRFGYLFADAKIVAQLNKVRPPYNVNVLTQESILFALEHYERLMARASALKKARDLLYQRFSMLKNFRCLNTQANFLLLQTKDADKVWNALQERNILVKNLNHTHPLLQNYLRLTVGSATDNQKLYQALEDIHES